jgi:hypothetical protein
MEMERHAKIYLNNIKEHDNTRTKKSFFKIISNGIIR